MDRNQNYHWGATPEIMNIIRKRDNSPESQKLVERRTEIVKPGIMRIKRDSHGGEHWTPRRPDANGRREVVEIDLRLIERSRRRRQTDNTEATNSGTESRITSRTDSDAETAILTNPTGTLYPAIDTRNFGNEPIQIIEYLQINKIITTPSKKTVQQEDNVREAELRFMADLRTIIKETSRDREMIATMIGLEKGDENSIPDTYFRQYKQLSTRWGIIFLDDRIIIPSGMRDNILNALPFGHPGETKMLQDAKIFWWPGMADDIKTRQRECISCRNAGKNLKTQLPLTDKSKIITNEPGEELQLDFTGELISNKLNNRPKILVAVDHFSKWTTASICSNTETKTVIKFLERHFNLHGIPKRIRTDNDTAFTSKEFKNFCKEYNIERITGLPYIHTATGLVERTIQSLKNLILANLEDEIGLTESLNRALNVLRFTVHTGKGKTPFELHHGRKPRTKLTNLINKQTSLLSDWKSICDLENPGRLPVYITRDKNGNVSDYLIMSKRREEKPAATTTPTSKRKTIRIPVNKKFPYFFVEKHHQKKSFDSKYKPKLQKAISETEHTVLTDKNRRVHKNQITGPVHIEPEEQITMTFQKARRTHSESPRRRSTTPRNQKRNALGRFTTDTETTTGEKEQPVENEQPGASTPIYETQNLFVPNLFVNSTEEGEIDMDEGNENLDTKPEIITNETVITEQENHTEKIMERKSGRTKRRPNYYGAIKYC